MHKIWSFVLKLFLELVKMMARGLYYHFQVLIYLDLTHTSKEYFIPFRVHISRALHIINSMSYVFLGTVEHNSLWETLAHFIKTNRKEIYKTR